MTDQPDDPPPGEGTAPPEPTEAAYESFLPPDDPVMPELPARATTDDDLREAVGVARGKKKGKARAIESAPLTRASRERAPDAATTAPGEPPELDDADVRARARDRELADRDDRDADETPLTPDQQARRRRLRMTLGLSLVVGLILVAFVFIGRANGDRLVVRCAADRITAERGRGFPPWGTRTLDGPEWAAIAIPPQAECKSRETEDVAVLEGWYLDALLDQARAKLTAREVTAVEDADKLLRQALLLTRAPERRDQRREIERLLGDVGYWRGAAKVKAATDALADAAKLFDDAAARKPVNVTNASAWGDYARAVGGELKQGPESLRPPPPLGAAPGPTRTPAPPGVALPVESTGPVAPPPTPLTPPDAGVPSGGVLL